jgi:hypothetical protein
MCNRTRSRQPSSFLNIVPYFFFISTSEEWSQLTKHANKILISRVPQSLIHTVLFEWPFTSAFGKSLAADLTDVVPDVQVDNLDVLFLEINNQNNYTGGPHYSLF